MFSAEVHGQASLPAELRKCTPIASDLIYLVQSAYTVILYMFIRFCARLCICPQWTYYARSLNLPNLTW